MIWKLNWRTPHSAQQEQWASPGWKSAKNAMAPGRRILTTYQHAPTAMEEAPQQGRKELHLDYFQQLQRAGNAGARASMLKMSARNAAAGALCRKPGRSKSRFLQAQ